MRRLVKVLATAGLLLGLLAATARAQGPPPPLPLPEPKVTPIQVTGPPAQRLNLIILGDGYQWDQQSIFYADVDRNLSVMWATEPFRSYRNYMNVYAVELGLDRLRHPLRPGQPRPHADGTIRDTGVFEQPSPGSTTHGVNTKNTALRMMYRTAAPTRYPVARSSAPRRPTATPRISRSTTRPARPTRARPAARRTTGSSTVRGSGAGHPVQLAEPPVSGDLQHVHVRRHRRHPGDHVRWLAAGPADLAARTGPLARLNGRRVSVLLARRGRSVRAIRAASRAASTTRS